MSRQLTTSSNSTARARFSTALKGALTNLGFTTVTNTESAYIDYVYAAKPDEIGAVNGNFVRLEYGPGAIKITFEKYDKMGFNSAFPYKHDNASMVNALARCVQHLTKGA